MCRVKPQGEGIPRVGASYLGTALALGLYLAITVAVIIFKI
jgi:hypothetical protein